MYAVYYAPASGKDAQAQKATPAFPYKDAKSMEQEMFVETEIAQAYCSNQVRRRKSEGLECPLEVKRVK